MQKKLGMNKDAPVFTPLSPGVKPPELVLSRSLLHDHMTTRTPTLLERLAAAKYNGVDIARDVDKFNYTEDDAIYIDIVYTVDKLVNE